MKKIALITGAACGIGAAIASTLVAEVDCMLLLDKNDEALSNLTLKFNTHQSEIRKYVINLAHISEVNRFIDMVGSENLSPNILINNAGYGGEFQFLNSVSEQEWDAIFNINVKSHFLFAKAFLPIMKKNNFGRIITIASVQGFLGAVCSSAYSASKHAATGLIKTLAAEWGCFGITSNAISPGYVNTKMGIQDHKMTDHSSKVIGQTPIKRIAEPIEIAGLVKYLISADASFINGENIVIDGGLTCHVGTQ